MEGVWDTNVLYMETHEKTICSNKGHITLKPIGWASQKYVIHIYSKLGPCVWSFIWMTLKLWKKFDSQAFSEVLVLFITTIVCTFNVYLSNTKVWAMLFLINLRQKSSHFNALVNLKPSIPVKRLEKVRITDVIFDLSMFSRCRHSQNHPVENASLIESFVDRKLRWSKALW